MFGIGSIVEKISDSLGLPEEFGDIAGGVAAYFTGDVAGMAEAGIDLAENFGIDVKSILPEPLYRAGMMYLSGGMDASMFQDPQFLASLVGPEWAQEAQGFQLAGQILANGGIQA